MEIKGVKLITGLDIIGKVLEETPEYIKLIDAVVVSIFQTQQGPAASLNPLDMFSSKADDNLGSEVKIYWASALFPYTPHAHLEKRYTEQMSGIDLSAAGSIIAPR